MVAMEGRMSTRMVWLALGIVGVLIATRVFTSIRYHYILYQIRSANGKRRIVTDPPALPYWIPFVGHGLLMLKRNPGGKFWNDLMARHPREAGICTLEAGGKRMHLLWNTTAIDAMFKNRSNVDKAGFERDLWTKAFAISSQAYDSMVQHHHAFHDMNSKLLMRRNAVDELTTLFIEHLAKNFEAQPYGTRDVSLYTFIRTSMFEASVDTSFGTKLREQFYPDMQPDFDKYDVEMPSFYYGLPRFIAPSMYSNREKILGRLTAWNEANRSLDSRLKSDTVEYSSWDADRGSTYNRARHTVAAQAGFSASDDAAFDMAFIMGLSANVIRTTGWMILNIVAGNDPTILPRVLQEIENARIDGQKTLGVDKLVTSPLLQSIWTEALRCYIDNYTPRDIVRNMDLPMDEFGQRFVRLKSGDIIFAANYPVQTDPNVWGEQGFRADRFVIHDANGKESFQQTGKQGKIFPFGGGPEKCPGRIFAKQEAIAALGLFFSNFDVERTGFIDGSGNATDHFPTSAPMTTGSGAHYPDGDIRVNISRRQ